MYFAFGFFAGLVVIPILLGMARVFGLYTCVQECEAQVFTLFGKVIGTIFLRACFCTLQAHAPVRNSKSLTSG